MALTSGVQNGSWFLMKFGDKVIGGQTNATLNSSSDKIYTTSKLSKEGRKTVIIGEFEETLSIEGIAEFLGGTVDYSTANWQALYAAYRAKTLIDFDLVQCIDPNATYPEFTTIGEGKCYITSCPLQMPENDRVSWSIEAHINEFTLSTIV